MSVFSDGHEVSDRPHRERLQRQQHLGAAAIGDVLQNDEVATHRLFVDDEAGRRHAAKVELGEGARAAGLGLHNGGDQKANGAARVSTFQGRPWLFISAMNGSGSSCSMLNTPAPFQAPVSISDAPIIAGTPVV